MRVPETDELKELKKENFNNIASQLNRRDVVSVGQYFKIQHTYFRITEIDSVTNRIVAKGVSRKEYFKNR